MLVTENADGSHTVTIGDRSWTLPAKREQAGKVVNVRTYLNLRTGPGTDYTVIGRLLNGAEVKLSLIHISGAIAQKYNCQLMRLDFQQEEGFMSSLPLGPVSYTHLDVYKRQA